MPARKRRPPQWDKLLVLQRHLSSSDYVVWVDADVLVTNPRKSIEEVIHADEVGEHVTLNPKPPLRPQPLQPAP